jgi:cellulose synthase/poly-beta-1,6-N-acetylglucosamine synthase-like glycosyltransferase
MEVLAYSDASTDATASLLENASNLLEPVISHDRLGKATGMRKIVAMSDAEILIFTDANVLLEPDSLPRLIRYFSDPEIGCVAGTLIYGAMDSTTARVGGWYWKLEEKIKHLESATGSTMGADGSIFARRKQNYPDVPPDLLDDMTTSTSVIFDSLRCISAKDVIAYENAISSSKEEFNRKKRISCRAFSTYLYLRNDLKKMSLLNRFKFVSHKLIRWWGGLFILTGAFSLVLWGGMIGMALPIFSVLAVGALLVVFLGRMGVPGVSSIYEVLLAIFATGLGVAESIRGRKYRTWETANTR